MHFSLEDKTASLSIGEFSDFSLGPRESGGSPHGLWRAQLGQHWHNEMRSRAEKELPGTEFEIPVEGRLVHRGWTITLSGRIDQRVGSLLREIKSVTLPLPAEETLLRTDYPAYFLQLAAYVVLERTLRTKETRGELVFVEASAGLVQTIALTPFDEALVFHQLDALVGFLDLQRRAIERRRSLHFQPPFPSLRPGQETIQQDLLFAFNSQPSTLLFEAPTGYGKTGCVLEFALGQLKSGRFSRLVWLTGKSTGQLQVTETLRTMTTPDPSPSAFHLPPTTSVAVWQVRNKSEHCVNHTFHCVRDNCDYLRDCAERWPQSGLSRFYLDETQPRDLASLRTAGRDARICPYEITRAALPFNDVWIGDYNYVFAPDSRGVFFERPGFEPSTTLLVVDEAHNLPSRVAAAHSHTADENDARSLLAELDHLRAPAPLVLAIEEWVRLLGSLQPAESLDPTVEAEIHELVEKLSDLTATLPLDYAALGPQHSATLWQFPALAGFLADATLIKLLWMARPGRLEFSCVDAATAIGAALRLFGGAILMSATLRPYPEFAESCGLEDGLAGGGVPAEPLPSLQSSELIEKPRLIQRIRPTFQTLNAPAPWRAGAYDVAVDRRVDTSFRQRAKYYSETAATIEEVCRASGSQLLASPKQGGGGSTFNFQPTATPCVAVFFPSYAYAEAVLGALEEHGSVLRSALQPRLADLAAQAAWVEENLALSDVLFLVLGGSFAEGIDLLGGRVTHAIVVGPALPEVNAMQKARVAALGALGREAAFRRVYQIPGLQKVNQALGRLVRAPGQRAKVLLHCRRFAEPSYSSLLDPEYQFYQEITDDTTLREWLEAP
jgi:DNA excision repair protein ERCC-2